MENPNKNYSNCFIHWNIQREKCSIQWDGWPLVWLEYQDKRIAILFESLWYCQETTAFNLGSDTETIRKLQSAPEFEDNPEMDKIQRWMLRGTSQCTAGTEMAKMADSFALRLSESQIAASPVLLITCSSSQSYHKSDPVLGFML